MTRVQMRVPGEQIDSRSYLRGLVLDRQGRPRPVPQKGRHLDPLLQAVTSAIGINVKMMVMDRWRE
ncbi:MAG: hypothetical protein JWQ49_3500 [Edaphobacter sp.]|jgi:hypothetical protein|nr:hypothetical protein [Edaphobacter sp.]